MSLKINNSELKKTPFVPHLRAGVCQVEGHGNRQSVLWVRHSLMVDEGTFWLKVQAYETCGKVPHQRAQCVIGNYNNMKVNAEESESFTIPALLTWQCFAWKRLESKA